MRYFIDAKAAQVCDLPPADGTHGTRGTRGPSRARGGRSTVTLLSLAAIAEDDRELYVVNEDAVWNDCDARTLEHAWPNLHTFADDSVIDPEEDFYLPGPLLARQVERLLAGDEAPEFWGFGGLDASRGWTAVCSLWGAAGLPEHFPRRWWDLEQLCWQCGWDPSVLVRERFGEEAPIRHNALEDARWIRRLHISVTDHVKERGLRGIAGALRQRLVDDRSLRRGR